MSELRQNKLTKQWVIYAPARSKRPYDFQQPAKPSKEPAIFEPACPFCPGNEHQLGACVLKVPHHQDPSCWQIKVVLNKFPALTAAQHPKRLHQGPYIAIPGYGHHEVIIESPDHNRDIPQMSIAEVNLIIETYHRRYVEMAKDHQNMMTLIFRNHGARAGASLVHPHSQMITTPIVPPNVRWREQEAQRYFDEYGRCVCCDIVEYETQNRQRVILENRSFIAFIPFAAEVPCEIWIMPKQHQACFSRISDLEKADLAIALHQCLTKLSQKLQDPDYNYMIHTAAEYKADEPQLHWYLQLLPRQTIRSGFELGSGIIVNPSLPEADAQLLQKTDCGTYL